MELYIVYGYKPSAAHEDNATVDPNEKLAEVEIYRTEDPEEVAKIMSNGGYIPESDGIFRPATRYEGPLDASDASPTVDPAVIGRDELVRKSVEGLNEEPYRKSSVKE